MQENAPPHCIDSEKGVLGCILVEPDCLGECVELLKDGPEVFFDKRHAVAYQELVSMYESGDPIDQVSFGSRVLGKKLTKAVGGIGYILDCTNLVTSTENISHYIKVLNEKRTLRQLKHGAYEIQQLIDGGGTPTDELIAKLDSELQNATRQVGRTRILPLRTVVRNCITQAEDAFTNKGKNSGILTGYRDLDKMTMGLNKGDMFVLAARPSMGKTSLAMNIVENVAINQGIPVGVLSIEMTTQSLVMRMICGNARLNSKRVTTGDMNEMDMKSFSLSCGKLSQANNIWIDDSSDITPAQARAKARRMKQDYGIEMLVIDYLQLMKSTVKGSTDQQGQEKSNAVKSIAKELGIPVIALCQLNREIEKDKKRKPKMSDLRESGSIEQDADLIGFLYKPEPEQGQEEDFYGYNVQQTNLFIAKQRNGATGDVPLLFHKEYTRFETMSRIDDSEIPE